MLYTLMPPDSTYSPNSNIPPSPTSSLAHSRSSLSPTFPSKLQQFTPSPGPPSPPQRMYYSISLLPPSHRPPPSTSDPSQEPTKSYKTTIQSYVKTKDWRPGPSRRNQSIPGVEHQSQSATTKCQLPVRVPASLKPKVSSESQSVCRRRKCHKVPPPSGSHKFKLHHH